MASDLLDDLVFVRREPHRDAPDNDADHKADEDRKEEAPIVLDALDAAEHQGGQRSNPYDGQSGSSPGSTFKRGREAGLARTDEERTDDRGEHPDRGDHQRVEDGLHRERLAGDSEDQDGERDRSHK